tara:strand:- start:113 stop:1333 length:1221 start_codon:yes stop_codon:yes gene_type:complete
MATKITDLTELSATAASGDFLHIIDVADPAGGTAGTSKKIQVSNLPGGGGGGAVSSVNGQTGVVVLNVNDINDVVSTSPTGGDVLEYNLGLGKWIESSKLTTLWSEFRNGTSVNIYADGVTSTEGRVELTATGANLKTGVSGLTVTETSPGTLTFSVAAGGAGVETQYNAAFLNGQTTAGSAHLLLKSGTEFRLENAGGYETWLRQNPSAAANITVGLPATGGTLALTTDIPSGVVTAVTGTAPIVSSGGTTPAVSISAATISAAGSMSSADKTKLDNITTPYEEDEIFAGQNITMNSSVSVTSNRIVDIMGDALADTSNANSKKFIGYHTGSGVCVLQGMVDAGASISGATGGSPLWIGASGAFSATAPTTTNYYSRVVGYYVGGGVGGEQIVYFNPSQDWVQIS